MNGEPGEPPNGAGTHVPKKKAIAEGEEGCYKSGDKQTLVILLAPVQAVALRRAWVAARPERLRRA